MRGRFAKNIVGMRFGKLTVVARANEDRISSTGKSAMWTCICDFGKTVDVLGTSLRRGHTRSCGCLAHLRRVIAQRKHGGCNEKLYRVWASMKQRCTNVNDKRYHRYGGRGISFCDEWKDYSAFSDWAKNNGYSDGLCLDRINNDGNYEPNNCRWVTNKENCNNMSRNVLIQYEGRVLTVSEAADKYGIPYKRLLYRIRAGWPIEKAIRTGKCK